jgi:hypothetical protein
MTDPIAGEHEPEQEDFREDCNAMFVQLLEWLR